MSARTVFASAGVTTPAREPAGVRRRKAVRLPSKARLAHYRSRSSLATVRWYGSQVEAVRPPAKSGARARSRSLLTAGRRKGAPELSTNLDRSSAPLPIDHQIEPIRSLNKHPRRPALPPALPVFLPCC